VTRIARYRADGQIRFRASERIFCVVIGGAAPIAHVMGIFHQRARERIAISRCDEEGALAAGVEGGSITICAKTYLDQREQERECGGPERRGALRQFARCLAIHRHRTRHPTWKFFAWRPINYRSTTRSPAILRAPGARGSKDRANRNARWRSKRQRRGEVAPLRAMAKQLADCAKRAPRFLGRINEMCG